MTADLVHFAELRSAQAGSLTGTPVLLLPIGAVEPHGPHAPLATDTIISLAVCERAVALLSSDRTLHPLVLPPIPYGVTHFSSMFPGSVSISETTLHALVVDICTALEEQGLHHRVIVNSHFEPAHVEALRRAASETRTAFLDVTRRRLAERLTDEFRSGAAHAGRYETSLLLATRPGLVDEESMRSLPECFVDMPAGIAAGRDDFLALGMPEAYCGAPAQSTAGEGEAILVTLSTMLVELIREKAAG